MPFLYALSYLYTPYAPLQYLVAIQYHTRHGAAPPAYQYYHTGPCSWRSALEIQVLYYVLLQAQYVGTPSSMALGFPPAT
jgi:hypothetical protein